MKHVNGSWLSKLATITAILGFATTAQAATGVFEKGVETSETVTIEISTTAGEVVVQGADIDHVSIRGVVKVDDRMSKRDPIGAGGMIRAVKAKPPVEVIDGRIIVGQLKRRTHQRHLEISYVITVPKHSDVSAHSISGDVRVSGVNGFVNATSETGKVVRAETEVDDNDRA
jgi:hypothetical protein